MALSLDDIKDIVYEPALEDNEAVKGTIGRVIRSLQGYYDRNETEEMFRMAALLNEIRMYYGFDAIGIPHVDGEVVTNKNLRNRGYEPVEYEPESAVRKRTGVEGETVSEVFDEELTEEEKEIDKSQTSTVVTDDVSTFVQDPFGVDYVGFDDAGYGETRGDKDSLAYDFDPMPMSSEEGSVPEDELSKDELESSTMGFYDPETRRFARKKERASAQASVGESSQFTSVDELSEIRGIGSKTQQKLENRRITDVGQLRQEIRKNPDMLDNMNLPTATQDTIMEDIGLIESQEGLRTLTGIGEAVERELEGRGIFEEEQLRNELISNPKLLDEVGVPPFEDLRAELRQELGVDKDQMVIEDEEEGFVDAESDKPRIEEFEVVEEEPEQEEPEQEEPEQEEPEQEEPEQEEPEQVETDAMELQELTGVADTVAQELMDMGIETPEELKDRIQSDGMGVIEETSFPAPHKESLKGDLNLESPEVGGGDTENEEESVEKLDIVVDMDDRNLRKTLGDENADKQIETVRVEDGDSYVSVDISEVSHEDGRDSIRLNVEDLKDGKVFKRDIKKIWKSGTGYDKDTYKFYLKGTQEESKEDSEEEETETTEIEESESDVELGKYDEGERYVIKEPDIVKRVAMRKGAVQTDREYEITHVTGDNLYAGENDTREGINSHIHLLKVGKRSDEPLKNNVENRIAINEPRFDEFIEKGVLEKVGETEDEGEEESSDEIENNAEAVLELSEKEETPEKPAIDIIDEIEETDNGYKATYDTSPYKTVFYLDRKGNITDKQVLEPELEDYIPEVPSDIKPKLGDSKKQMWLNFAEDTKEYFERKNESLRGMPEKFEDATMDKIDLLDVEKSTQSYLNEVKDKNNKESIEEFLLTIENIKQYKGITNHDGPWVYIFRPKYKQKDRYVAIHELVELDDHQIERESEDEGEEEPEEETDVQIADNEKDLYRDLVLNNYKGWYDARVGIYSYVYPYGIGDNWVSMTKLSVAPMESQVRLPILRGDDEFGANFEVVAPFEHEGVLQDDTDEFKRQLKEAEQYLDAPLVDVEKIEQPNDLEGLRDYVEVKNAEEEPYEKNIVIEDKNDTYTIRKAPTEDKFRSSVENREEDLQYQLRRVALEIMKKPRTGNPDPSITTDVELDYSYGDIVKEIYSDEDDDDGFDEAPMMEDEGEEELEEETKSFEDMSAINKVESSNLQEDEEDEGEEELEEETKSFGDMSAINKVESSNLEEDEEDEGDSLDNKFEEMKRRLSPSDFEIGKIVPENFDVSDYAGDNVKLQGSLARVSGVPKIIKAEVSSSGKTMSSEEESKRFDTETILSGEREVRTRLYQLYNPFEWVRKYNMEEHRGSLSPDELVEAISGENSVVTHVAHGSSFYEWLEENDALEEFDGDDDDGFDEAPMMDDEEEEETTTANVEGLDVEVSQNPDLVARFTDEYKGNDTYYHRSRKGNKKYIAEIQGSDEQYGLDRGWIIYQNSKTSDREEETHTYSVGDLIERRKYTHSGKNDTQQFLVYLGDDSFGEIDNSDAQVIAEKIDEGFSIPQLIDIEEVDSKKNPEVEEDDETLTNSVKDSKESEPTEKARLSKDELEVLRELTSGYPRDELTSISRIKGIGEATMEKLPPVSKGVEINDGEYQLTPEAKDALRNRNLYDEVLKAYAVRTDISSVSAVESIEQGNVEKDTWGYKGDKSRKERSPSIIPLPSVYSDEVEISLPKIAGERAYSNPKEDIGSLTDERRSGRIGLIPHGIAHRLTRLYPEQPFATIEIPKVSEFYEPNSDKNAEREVVIKTYESVQDRFDNNPSSEHRETYESWNYAMERVNELAEEYNWKELYDEYAEDSTQSQEEGDEEQRDESVLPDEPDLETAREIERIGEFESIPMMGVSRQQLEYEAEERNAFRRLREKDGPSLDEAERVSNDAEEFAGQVEGHDDEELINKAERAVANSTDEIGLSFIDEDDLAEPAAERLLEGMDIDGYSVDELEMSIHNYMNFGLDARNASKQVVRDIAREKDVEPRNLLHSMESHNSPNTLQPLDKIKISSKDKISTVNPEGDLNPEHMMDDGTNLDIEEAHQLLEREVIGKTTDDLWYHSDRSLDKQQVGIDVVKRGTDRYDDGDNLLSTFDSSKYDVGLTKDTIKLKNTGEVIDISDYEFMPTYISVSKIRLEDKSRGIYLSLSFDSKEIGGEYVLNYWSLGNVVYDGAGHSIDINEQKPDDLREALSNPKSLELDMDEVDDSELVMSTRDMEQFSREGAEVTWKGRKSTVTMEGTNQVKADSYRVIDWIKGLYVTQSQKRDIEGVVIQHPEVGRVTENYFLTLDSDSQSEMDIPSRLELSSDREGERLASVVETGDRFSIKGSEFEQDGLIIGRGRGNNVIEGNQRARDRDATYRVTDRADSSQKPDDIVSFFGEMLKSNGGRYKNIGKNELILVNAEILGKNDTKIITEDKGLIRRYLREKNKQ